MLESIVEATKNFCIHQLRCTPNELESIDYETELYVGELEVITKDNEKYIVYVCASKNFIQNVAFAMLEEEQSDDETLYDMAMECTNLIVGSAKVIASKKNVDFDIATPKVNFETLKNKDLDIKIITCNDEVIAIGMKKV